jgi:Spy/CpxP family protein refolding chaperone
MRRSTAIAAIAALFLVGVLVGVLGTHVFYLRHLQQPGWLLKTGTRLLAAELKRSLDLTPEQQRQVGAILADAQQDAFALRREMMPRVIAILDRTHSRISAVLTPEQRERFERLRERRASRWRRVLTGG